MIGITKQRRESPHCQKSPHAHYESQMEFGLRRRCSIGNILSAPISRSPRFRPDFWLRTCPEAKTQVRCRRISTLIVLPTITDRGRRQTLPRCRGGHTGYFMKHDLDSDGCTDRETIFIQIVRSQGRPPSRSLKSPRFQSNTGNCLIGMITGSNQVAQLLPLTTSKTIPYCGSVDRDATFGPMSMPMNMSKDCGGISCE